MDTKTAPADKSDECCFFIGIVLFGREVIILSNLLVLQPHMQPIFTHQKRHSFECLLCHGAICLRKSIIR